MNGEALVVTMGRVATIIMKDDTVVDLTAEQDSSSDFDSIDVEERK
mgnify:CR=1 FL=1